MTDKLEIQNQQDVELKRQLEKIDWPIDYGLITIQLRAGKPALLRIERTVRLDYDMPTPPPMSKRSSAN